MNKKALDKLDKLLASYGEGRTKEDIRGIKSMAPTKNWFIDIDRFDTPDKWNELYRLCQKAGLPRIRWTNNQLAKSDNDGVNFNAFDTEKRTSGWKLYIVCKSLRYSFYYGWPDLRLKGGHAVAGGKGWTAMRKELKKDGIDIKSYAIESKEGRRIKSSSDFPKPKIDMAGAPSGQTFEHCNHIDFHSSYPAGLANTHPEFRPTIERVYLERKTNPNRKLSLNCFIGCRQSPKATWGCRWAHLAKDAIEDNNRRIREMDARLLANGDKILGHNTDGIWYQGPIYHGEGEGDDLGQWHNDHVDCRFRAKSKGAYEFIENGKYYPVVRGITELDFIKPDRNTWKWGDIFKHYKSFIPELDDKKGIVMYKVDSQDADNFAGEL